MSFSSDTKNELSKLNNLKNKKEVYAELLGYLYTANVSNNNGTLKFSSENEYNINRFTKLLNNMNIEDYDISIQGKIYSIFLKEIKIGLSLKEILKEDNTKRAFIRGSFLGGGSINNPKNKYHLEILFSKKTSADFYKSLLYEYNIESKILENNKNYAIYIKDGEKISSFLALIGANAAILRFEEIRVLRDMKNNVNRIVNCETANMNKTINTSVKQILIVKKIREAGKFDLLPEYLKEMAILREENPDLTLEELGKKLKNPIGKSTVSGRFKKMTEYIN